MFFPCLVMKGAWAHYLWEGRLMGLNCTHLFYTNQSCAPELGSVHFRPDSSHFWECILTTQSYWYIYEIHM